MKHFLSSSKSTLDYIGTQNPLSLQLLLQRHSGGVSPADLNEPRLDRFNGYQPLRVKEACPDVFHFQPIKFLS
jgi:hypothetical protein